jgi:AmmeMemoRadiSam system protein A
MLSDADRLCLLQLARRALEARVRRQPAPGPVSGGAFDLRCGAFVTLHIEGELRGCLGRIERDAPLSETILDLAAIVSDSDPRFAPVRLEELAAIEIEISVLTPEREVTSVTEIEVGRHGLIIERGARRGLLLPQVPVEYGWDRDTFLEHTCLKAGLSRNDWRHGARICVFEAVVFGEGALAPSHLRTFAPLPPHP